MTHLLSRFPIRLKVMCGAVSILALVSLFNFVYYPSRERARTVAALENRTTNTAELVALGIGIAVEANELSAVSAALAWAKRDPSLAYIVVVDTAGELFASYPKMVDLDISRATALTGLRELPGFSRRRSGSTIGASTRELWCWACHWTRWRRRSRAIA